MPPFRPVQSLYSLTLGAFFDVILDAVHRSSDCVDVLRKLVLSSLHTGIREHLVQLATMHCRNDAYTLMDLLSVFLDHTTRRLDHSRGDDHAWLRAEQCAGLFTRLDQCGATGLHELTVKVRLDPRQGGDLETVSAANKSFHRVLRNGLAQNLHTLILRSVCDNEILRLLGRNCPTLNYLDATSSWLVDDGGIRQLCFKEPELYSDISDGYADGNETYVDVFFRIQPSELNTCCRTLHEVRIQDTNTSEVGVIMLVLFIPNLKSLGGFIYYRNVGDAIVNLALERTLVLSLTDLWDTSMPPEKAALLCRSVPQLSSLYTRGSWLCSLTAFKNLTSLTVDFDFVDFSYSLEEYLVQAGSTLKKLVLVDQNHPISLVMLAENCPALEELGAKLEGDWFGHFGNMLPELKTCRVRIGSTATLRSLLVHAKNLTALELTLEEDAVGDTPDVFDDTVIAQALAADNAVPEKLRVFLMNSECGFTVNAVQLMINSCPELRFLGELQMWTGLNERDIEDLFHEIRERNLDLMLRYRGHWYPYRKGCHAITSRDH